MSNLDIVVVILMGVRTKDVMITNSNIIGSTNHRLMRQ